MSPMAADGRALVLASDGGVVLCRRRGGTWREEARTLTERTVTAVVMREGVILAGTTEGVFRSDDEGGSWRQAGAGMSTRHLRWMAYHPDLSDREFAGTEPAGIFVSHDGAASWRACPEVAALRDRHRWFLPYSPEAGCVRGFAFHGDRAYAAVEVGGLLRSDDAGETWRLADGSTGTPALQAPPLPLIHPDVHSVVGHPSSPDLVFAATGGGLYRSADGGASWTRPRGGVYCRAVWADPADPDHLVLSPADGVERNGRIEETRDGGRTWSVASEGLDVPWPHRLAERFYQLDGELLAVLSDGELLAADRESLHWRRILPEVERVNAVAHDPAG